MMNSEENQEKPQNPKQVLERAIETKSKDLLHYWIETYLKVNIPRVKICPDHDAPFDFVADYVFGLHDFMIVLANRTGGKTLNFGILDAMMAYSKDNTEIATVGAIQFQAQKAYEYFKDFSQKYPFAYNLLSPTMSKTELVNGSKVQILTGTMSGVNSPHPQLVFLDEIDLMPWVVLQQALSMATSKGGVRARTVLTSTRKFANGPMQRLMDEAEARHAKVYQWCVWEVVEKLPEDQEELNKIYETFGASLPQRITEANGYYQWNDALTKFNQLDAETWETEWICKRPGLQGVVYGSAYSDDANLLLGWSPKGKPGYLYLFEDFGFGEGHEDVTLFCWIPLEKDRIVVFDELYMLKAGTDDIWEEQKKILQKHGYVMPDIKTGVKGSIRGWVPDYHGLTEIQDRASRGAPMVPKVDDSEMYLVNNGIKVVKKFLETGRLMITDLCPRLRVELLSYHYHKNANGTYSTNPDKVEDNGVDALRYGLIALFNWLASKTFERRKPQDRVEKDPLYRPIAKPPKDKPITSGMLDKRY